MSRHHASIIQLWPRPCCETISEDTGVSIYAVRKWQTRNKIPAKYHTLLLNVAAERGIQLTRSQLEGK